MKLAKRARITSTARRIGSMLLGLIHPTSGTGTVLGEPLGNTAGYLNRVGALIESPAFHPAVSGIDNLRSLAVLGSRSQKNIPDLIELVGLAGRGHDRVGSTRWV